MLVSAQRALVALAVAVNDDPTASTLRHEAGLYAVLAVHIVPMLFFAAHQSLNGMRVLVQKPRNALLPWPLRGKHCPWATKPSPSPQVAFLVGVYESLSCQSSLSVGSLSGRSQRPVGPGRQSSRIHRLRQTRTTRGYPRMGSISVSKGSRMQCSFLPSCAWPWCLSLRLGKKTSSASCRVIKDLSSAMYSDYPNGAGSRGGPEEPPHDVDD